LRLFTGGFRFISAFADQPVAAITINSSLPGKQIKVNGVTMHVFD